MISSCKLRFQTSPPHFSSCLSSRIAVFRVTLLHSTPTRPDFLSACGSKDHDWSFILSCNVCCLMELRKKRNVTIFLVFFCIGGGLQLAVLGWKWDGTMLLTARVAFFCLLHICTPESVDNIFTALNVRAMLRWNQTHLQDKFGDLKKQNKNRFLSPLYQEPDQNNKEKSKIWNQSGDC